MIEYLIKSTLAISIVYTLYVLFMRNNIDFRWLRLYFIGSVLVSLVVPGLKYLALFQQDDLMSIPVGYIPEFVFPVYPTKIAAYSALPAVMTVFRIVYLTGFAFSILRSLLGLFQLGILVWKHGIHTCYDLKFVLIPELPCSFACFNLIFIDPVHLQDNENIALIRHEKVHVRQWHSLDLFLMEILTAVQWFNPLAIKLKRAVTDLHEFMADEGAIGNESPLEYQHLLLSQVCGINTRSHVSGFNGSLTKKRILMITKNRRSKRWFAAFSILMVAILFTDALSRVNLAQQPLAKKQTENNKMERNLTVKDTLKREVLPPIPPPPPPPAEIYLEVPSSPESAGSNNPEDRVFIVVEQNSLFQGSDVNAFREWVQKNLVYPGDAAKDKIEGKVIIQFIVNKNGKVVKPMILRGVSESLDAEALRVIKLSPDWQPALQGGKAVAQQFVIPVKFSL